MRRATCHDPGTMRHADFRINGRRERVCRSGSGSRPALQRSVDPATACLQSFALRRGTACVSRCQTCSCFACQLTTLAGSSRGDSHRWQKLSDAKRNAFCYVKADVHPSSPVPSLPPSGKPCESSSSRPRRGRRHRPKFVALGVLALTALSVAGWLGVRHTTWFGPWLADGLRAALGVENVARLEELTAAAEDRGRRLWPPAPPRSLEQVRPKPALRPSDTALAPAAAPAPAPTGQSLRPAFRPRDVGPMLPAVAAPADGSWTAVTEPGVASEDRTLWTTLLHPDTQRPWAEVFVVAIDARRVRLELEAGTHHPKGSAPEALDYPRHGLIPAGDRQHLLAAFNGGFKAEHGHYGMHVDGVTLIVPRQHACTIASTREGELYIGTWQRLASTAAEFAWWRQTPPCLVEDGASHPALRDESERRWGAMPDGETVIRRSALGLDRDGHVLFMSVSNFTTAQAIAAAMRHVGAHDVAELDVNWSFPHFVIFRNNHAGELEAVGLFKGFLFDEQRYLKKPSSRDFFYLVHTPERDS